MLATAFTRFPWYAWTGFYRALGLLMFRRLGRRCRFEGWVDVPQFGGAIEIGSGVRFCKGVSLTVTRGARLVIEDGVFLGRGVVISAHNEIRIGAHTMVAEYVCLHDNDHLVDGGVTTGFSSAPLHIGARCWLGAQATVLRGGGLGDACVLGAGAVLTKQIPSGAVAVGVPARVLQR